MRSRATSCRAFRLLSGSAANSSTTLQNRTTAPFALSAGVVVGVTRGVGEGVGDRIDAGGEGGMLGPPPGSPQESSNSAATAASNADTRHQGRITALPTTAAKPKTQLRPPAVTESALISTVVSLQPRAKLESQPVD